MSKKYKLIILLLIITLILSNIVTYTKYKEIKHAEETTFSLLVNRFYFYGISLPYESIQVVNERMANESIDKEGVTTWLHEIISNMSVAVETSSLAANHWNLTIGDKNQYDAVIEVSRFFESIRMNLDDILKTEKDFAVWKQACTDLEEILQILKNNTDEQKIAGSDYNEMKMHWSELMEMVHEKHSNSRLLESYFRIYSDGKRDIIEHSYV